MNAPEKTYENMISGNGSIEKAIDLFTGETTKDNLIAVLESIHQQMRKNAQWIVPVIPPQAALQMFDHDKIRIGENFTISEDLHFKLHHLQTDDGKSWLAAFTSREEFEKGESASTIHCGIGEMLESCRDMSEAGIILNPWGRSFNLTKELIRMILDADKPGNHISIITGDITKLDVDVIVNAANRSLLGGGGVDGAIHRAAGPRLLEECRTLHGCGTGEAKITRGYDLKARFVIHTVGPVYDWREAEKCAGQLFACYRNSLELAKKHGLHTIAFPAISTGAYGYPKREAAIVSLMAVSKWMKENPEYGVTVILCCFEQEMKNVYQDTIEMMSQEARHK